LRVREIDGDALFARVQAHEIAALVGARGIKLQDRVAYFIAFAGTLDLDHARTQIREHARRVWTGEYACEIDYGETGKQGFAAAG